ncbi:MAG TPA: transketolase C-terminal domain-containing protein [Anaerolineales bacterium]|nr:transketolase C-terminal domain-containing protein [Anaerolineales bacterium]
MANQEIDWLRIARTVLLSRELDQLEEEQLTPQGKVKYQFSAMGHELAQVLLAETLVHSHDAAAVYYRSRPFMFACGLTPADALAAGMARTGTPSEGRDVGVIFNKARGNCIGSEDKPCSHPGLTIFPAPGAVGSHYSPAAGWAQGILYRQQILGETDWKGAIAVAMGGDGSVAANGFWAALNIVTTQKLPLLFFIEDNCYGISVPSILQTPGGNIAANLECYGNLHVLDGDGTNPPEAWEQINAAVDYVRSGAGPCLLRLRVPRLHGHTFIDDQAYKTPEERANEEERDPVDRLKKFLSSQKVTQRTWNKLVKEVRAELAAALNEAEMRPEPDSSQVRKHLLYDGKPPLQGGLRPENASIPPGSDTPNPAGARINLIDAVRRTLEVEMKQNPRLLVFGEDVGAKGGVHGATMDMQLHFGSERVFDTSLSEEGIIGRSIGLAYAGLLPVPEIQFRKYADPAHEQLSNIGIIRWSTAGKFAVPVVVRMPIGFGKKTGDPWHSFSAESIYTHLLGWRIAYPSHAGDAVGLLRSALRGDDPTIFFEHRALLDSSESRQRYPGDEYCLPFGRAAILTDGDELTVITWGAMVHRCVEAAKEFPGRVNVIDLRTLCPWDQDTVLESVRKSGRALVVHEDTRTGGFAGEIIATIAAQAFVYLDAPVERLTTPDVLIPYNIPMMEAVIPSLERIKTKVDELLSF